jgi:hypothetical protein
MAWVLGVCAAIGVWAVWRDCMPRMRMWLLAIVGLLATGKLQNVNHTLAHWLATTGNSWTVKLVGASVGLTIAAVFIVCEFWRHANPRNGAGGHRWAHSAMALIAPEIILAAGGVLATILGWSSAFLTTIPATIHGLF